MKAKCSLHLQWENVARKMLESTGNGISGLYSTFYPLSSLRLRCSVPHQLIPYVWQLEISVTLVTAHFHGWRLTSEKYVVTLRCHFNRHFTLVMPVGPAGFPVIRQPSSDWDLHCNRQTKWRRRTRLRMSCIK